MSLVACLQKLDEAKLRDIRDFVDSKVDEVEDIPPMTDKGFVRASGIYSFCPRSEAIRVIHGIHGTKVIPAQLARTFAFGRMFERYYRDEVLGDLGIVLGRWECRSCGNIPDKDALGATRYRKPQRCTKCGLRSEFRLHEETLTDMTARIQGHNDGFVYWANDYSILELKTCNDRYFGMIKKSGKPLDSHVAQAQMYMRMTGYKKTLFWYLNKNTSADYTIWMDYDAAYARVFVERAEALQEFFRSQTMPQRICANKDVELAKQCGQCSICFEGFGA